MPPPDAVKTAARTLDVFEVFARAKTPLTLTELANRIGSPISSCHALVRTLQARGYVYVLDEKKRVYPTKRLLATALDIAENDPILDRLHPILEALREETGETVILGKRQADRVVYLEVLEGRHTIRYSAEPGDLKPLHSSAIGKAMLGMLSEADLADLFRTLPLPAVTPNTLTRIDALRADLAASRARGWFMTKGENVAEVTGIAIAQRVAGEAYGIAVAGPVARLGAGRDAVLSGLATARAALERLDRDLTGPGRSDPAG